MPFDIDPIHLKKLAGDGAYERGQRYFEQGRVHDLVIRGNKANATVGGTEDYRVTLKQTAKILDGYCDCPASSGIDFCKHCVATALTIAEQADNLETLEQGGDLQRIEAALLKMEHAALVKELLGFIQQDDKTISRWVLKVDAQAGNIKPADLKKMITKSLPYRQIWDYSRVRNYFATAELQLASVFELLSNIPADKAYKLVIYAYERLNRALEQIDDSGGDRWGTEALLEEEFQVQFLRLDMADSEKAVLLIDAIIMEADIPPNASLELLDELPPAFLRVFYEKVLERFKVHLDDIRNRSSWTHHRLYHLLRDKAEIDKDRDTQLWLEIAIANSFRDYLQLGRKFLEHNRIDDAKHWLKQAISVAGKRDEDEVMQLEIDICSAEGRFDQASQLQWNKFQKTKRLGDFQRYCSLIEGDADQLSTKTAEAEQLLIKHAIAGKGSYLKGSSEPLLDFYILQHDWDKALEAATVYHMTQHQIIGLAQALLEHNIEKSMRVYKSLVPQIVSHADKRSYQQGVDLLKEYHRGIEQRGSDELKQQFQQLLNSIRAKEWRKKNLMKLLDGAFPV